MKIADIGGEFSLIRRLSKIVPGTDPRVVQGIGDDAAVIQVAPEPAPYLLVTTDLLVEARHFRRAWSTAEQIGIKAAECNISDIAAMGGRPHWMFVSLVLPEEEKVAWVEGLYGGLGESCRRYGIAVVGGDTTQGVTATICVTLLGSVTPSHLRLRSHARPGDILAVTGPLGGAAAALALLQSGGTPSPYLAGKHQTPRCRLDISGHIAPLARAMIDISDGLGSEVHHVCAQSNVGAEIRARDIPLHADVIAAARALGGEPLNWALRGGEDFELLFSISSENLDRLVSNGLTVHPVGHVTDRPGEVSLISAGGIKTPLPRGYDHFGFSA